MALADRDALMDDTHRTDNPAAAVELDDAFEKRAELARQRPALNRPGRTPGTGEIVVRPNDANEAEGNTVAMLRVLHAAQRWPSAPHQIVPPVPALDVVMLTPERRSPITRTFRRGSRAR